MADQSFYSRRSIGEWRIFGDRMYDEKANVDEASRRFLASLSIVRSVAKFGYSFDRAETEPCYIQPLLLEAREPSDEEIEQQSRQSAVLSAVNRRSWIESSV